MSKQYSPFNPVRILSSFPKVRNPTRVEKDLLVFSHLRWNCDFQRPRHLITRFARDRRVFYVEEPIWLDQEGPSYKIEKIENDIKVVVPVLPKNAKPELVQFMMVAIVGNLVADERIEDFVSWYYMPMALSFTQQLNPQAIVYDCTEDISAITGAPSEMIELENELLKRANVVFTDGQSLFEAKRKKHHNIYPFPSSIDRSHFAQSRMTQPDPKDQAGVPHPRLGFFGDLDERVDFELIEQLADLKPEWQIVMISPIVKVDESDLPRRANIHYLMNPNYRDIPRYLSGWDVGLLPFVLDKSTRLMSVKRTLEYLAAGRPVISTPIRDVVRPYAEENLVSIGLTATDFAECAEKLMGEDKTKWLVKVDEFLKNSSWDETFQRMNTLVRKAATSYVANRANDLVASFQNKSRGRMDNPSLGQP